MMLLENPRLKYCTIGGNTYLPILWKDPPKAFFAEECINSRMMDEERA